MALQAVITLNILCKARVDPSKLAFHQLHDNCYSWNADPLAPPGSRVVIYVDTKSHMSWGTRALGTWYCGPDLEHHQGNKVYVIDTQL